MADKASLTPEVVSPVRVRSLGYALACLVAAFVGGGLAVVEIAKDTKPVADQTLPVLRAASEQCLTVESLCTPSTLYSTVPTWLVAEWTIRDSDALLASARIVPALEDGEMVGFKIYALRAQSPLAVMGLANGDTVHSVAGTELSSIERSIAIYDALTSLAIGHPGEIDLEVKRNGCPLTIRLAVL